MPGHLNTFQRVMLQWNDLQPYNAAHVARLTRPLETDRLRRVIEASLARRGVSRLTVRRKRGTYEYQAGSAPIEIRTPAGVSTVESELGVQLERELNTPFQIDVPFCPVRFFALPDRDGFMLGAGYFHPMADAESVILLLRGIVADYLGVGGALPCHPFECHPGRWAGGGGAGVMLRALLELPWELRRMRHSYRPPLRDAEDLSNRLSLMTVGNDALNRLVGVAHNWKVTVHDVLLALLMQALAEAMPRRERQTRRRNLSLGSVVNVRGDCAMDRERTFGLFLGSFMVSHPVPAGISLRALATELRQQTSRIKRHKLYLGNTVKLAVARLLFELYSARRRKQFFHKYHPLVGGISNMNLDVYWPGQVQPEPADYFRVVSTGPATPLVLSVSTYRGRMTLAISYRPAVFSPARIGQIEGRLREGLATLEGGAR
jgi:hypothetical protein